MLPQRASGVSPTQSSSGSFSSPRGNNKSRLCLTDCRSFLLSEFFSLFLLASLCLHLSICLSLSLSFSIYLSLSLLFSLSFSVCICTCLFVSLSFRSLFVAGYLIGFFFVFFIPFSLSKLVFSSICLTGVLIVPFGYVTFSPHHFCCVLCLCQSISGCLSLDLSGGST